MDQNGLRVDLKEAFYNIKIEEADKHKTAFEVKGIPYEFNSMVMGFKDSPAILQRIMVTVLNELIGHGVKVHIDDVVIHATSRKAHDELLVEVCERLQENNLKINFDKLQIGMNEVKLLGVSINGSEIIPLEKQKEKILEAEIPKNISSLRKYLRCVSWYRSFIKILASKSYHLANSLRIKN